MSAPAGARLDTTPRAWVPAILVMAAIWLLSSGTPPSMPIHALPFRDRGAHFIAYAALAFFVSHGVRGSRLLGRDYTGPLAFADRVRIWTFALYTAVLWGLLDEVHQAFVPGRSPDAVDLVADALGAAIGGFARIALVRRPTTPAALAVEPS
jgi:VanZ family protein